MYKIKILIEWNRLEEAEKIINSLKKQGVNLDEFTYFNILILERRGEIDKSKVLHECLIDKISSKKINIAFKDEIYKYRI